MGMQKFYSQPIQLLDQFFKKIKIFWVFVFLNSNLNPLIWDQWDQWSLTSKYMNFQTSSLMWGIHTLEFKSTISYYGQNTIELHPTLEILPHGNLTLVEVHSKSTWKA